VRPIHIILTAVSIVAILAIGMLLGARLGRLPQIVPTANAQGLAVNQDQPDRLSAAAFSISQDGEVLYWWRVQTNGLGYVITFDSRTGSVSQKEFRR